MTREQPSPYMAWLIDQSCEDCGARYRDKRPDELWATESQCMRCLERDVRAEHCRIASEAG
jgi:hypothetical protein